MDTLPHGPPGPATRPEEPRRTLSWWRLLAADLVDVTLVAVLAAEVQSQVSIEVMRRAGSVARSVEVDAINQGLRYAALAAATTALIGWLCWPRWLGARLLSLTADGPRVRVGLAAALRQAVVVPLGAIPVTLWNNVLEPLTGVLIAVGWAFVVAIWVLLSRPSPRTGAVPLHRVLGVAVLGPSTAAPRLTGNRLLGRLRAGEPLAVLAAAAALAAALVAVLL